VVCHCAGVAIDALAAVNLLVYAATCVVAQVARARVLVIADYGVSDAFSTVAMVSYSAGAVVVAVGSGQRFMDTTDRRVTGVLRADEFVVAILKDWFGAGTSDALTWRAIRIPKACCGRARAAESPTTIVPTVFSLAVRLANAVAHNTDIAVVALPT